MIPFTKPGNEEVRKHLIEQFGDIEGCDICKIWLPPAESIIKTTEPLQTCHESLDRNDGLDENQCIPPGIYQVGEWFFVIQGFRPIHLISIIEIDKGLIFRFCFGQEELSLIDWRGAKKFNPDKTD